MTLVDCHIDADVAWIEFGEPDTKNLLTVALLDALGQRLADAADARVVVLRGRGNIWSAGYDVGSIPPEIFSGDPQVVARHPFERCMRALEECPVPTVAAIRGPVFGGALELAATCDLRLSDTGATFGLPPARLGIVYSHTGLAKLVRLLGPAHLRMLLFTGRAIDAGEAERIGLVNRVVADADLDVAVETLARDVAACAPLAVQGMKQVLRVVERGTPVSEAEVRSILQLRQRAFDSEDFAEGRRAFAAKRAARFEGR